MRDNLREELEDLQLFADPFEEFRDSPNPGGWKGRRNRAPSGIGRDHQDAPWTRTAQVPQSQGTVGERSIRECGTIS